MVAAVLGTGAGTGGRVSVLRTPNGWFGPRDSQREEAPLRVSTHKGRGRRSCYQGDESGVCALRGTCIGALWLPAGTGETWLAPNRNWPRVKHG